MATAPPAPSLPPSAPVDVLVPTDAGAMPARMWLPPTGRGPGIVLVQEIFGVTAYIRARAADLAAAGYVVVAPELYWRLPDAQVDERQPDFLQQAMAVAGRLVWDRAVLDVAAALPFVRARPEIARSGRVGVFGFCFGGGIAFDVAATHQPDALICYYGSALPALLERADAVTCPAIYHFGLADAYLIPATVARIRAAVAHRPGVAFHTFDGAGHAFDNPRPEFHHAQASATAWQLTLEFCRAVLPVTS